MSVALIIVVFAIMCCGLALWAVLGEHDLRHRWPPNCPARDTLAGMSPDALDVVRRAK